jgi:hypothetical protein
MNCLSFQDLLFEYLDDALAPKARADADAHLAECAACRDAVHRQQEVAQALTDRFRGRTESLALGPEAQRRIVAALRDASPQRAGEIHVRDWWRRLAWPFAVAASLLVASSLMTGFPFQPGGHDLRAARAPGSDLTGVSILISDCEPTYTFRRERNRVLDTFTCRPRVLEQTLWLSQTGKPAASDRERKTPL